MTGDPEVLVRPKEKPFVLSPDQIFDYPVNSPLVTQLRVDTKTGGLVDGKSKVGPGLFACLVNSTPM